MPQIFDLTEQYRNQLMSREDNARTSMLKDYRGIWRGLEDKIETAAKRIEFSDSEKVDLAAAFKDELASAGGGESAADLPEDKLSKFTGLLLQKNPWQELERELDRQFTTVADSAAGVTEDHRRALGQTAVDHAVKLMQAQIGKERVAGLSKEALAELNKRAKDEVERMWQEQREDLREAFRAKAAEAALQAREALRQEVLHGILINATAKQILGRVKSAIDDREANPETDPTLVRALRAEYRIATQNSYRESMRFVFAESGRVTRWRWTSARTARTCAVCWAMDGKVFPIETPLKSHPHCRCVPVPVVEDEEGNALRLSPGRTEREGGETGDAAFADIPPLQQKAILGMKAFAAYERGEFDLSDLIGVQFNKRFGVTLYRQSVDNAVATSAKPEYLKAAAMLPAYIDVSGDPKEPQPHQPHQPPQLLLRKLRRNVGMAYHPNEFDESGPTDLLNNIADTSGDAGGGSIVNEEPAFLTPPPDEPVKQIGNLIVGQKIKFYILSNESQYEFAIRVMLEYAKRAGLDPKYYDQLKDAIPVGTRIEKLRKLKKGEDPYFSDIDFKAKKDIEMVPDQGNLNVIKRLMDQTESDKAAAAAFLKEFLLPGNDEDGPWITGTKPNIDEAGLGKKLAWFAANNPEQVKFVFDQLDDLDASQVAEAMVAEMERTGQIKELVKTNKGRGVVESISARLSSRFMKLHEAWWRDNDEIRKISELQYRIRTDPSLRDPSKPAVVAGGNTTSSVLTTLKETINTITGDDGQGPGSTFNRQLVSSVRVLGEVLEKLGFKQVGGQLRGFDSSVTTMDKINDRLMKQYGLERPLIDEIGRDLQLTPEFIRDVLVYIVKGDFGEKRSTGATVGKFIGGLNPAGDVRDLIAGTLHVIQGKEGAWIELGGTIVGFLPLAGDLLKPMIKAEKKVGGKIVESLIQTEKQADHIPLMPAPPVKDTVKNAEKKAVSETASDIAKTEQAVTDAGKTADDTAVKNAPGKTTETPVTDGVPAVKKTATPGVSPGKGKPGQKRGSKSGDKKKVNSKPPKTTPVVNPPPVKNTGKGVKTAEKEGAGDAVKGGQKPPDTQKPPAIVKPVPGSPDHKVLKWNSYQARMKGNPKAWSYERWSKTYERNMVRAREANKAVDEYHLEIGWGEREVTVFVDIKQKIKRRLDIGDIKLKQAVEVKTGYITRSPAIRSEVERDAMLVKDGWKIEWHFKGTVSKGLLDDLDAAGIKYTGVTRPLPKSPPKPKIKP